MSPAPVVLTEGAFGDAGIGCHLVDLDWGNTTLLNPKKSISGEIRTVFIYLFMTGFGFH
jgi:hypothetical protein